MMDEELDMEDIESRLYSQVYHASVENEQNSNLNIEAPITVPLQSVQSTNPYTVNNVPNRSNRYFYKEHQANHQPTYISFDEINSLQNNISFSPNSTDITTEGNFNEFSNQFQNNITVNQYTVPLIINPELNEVLNPSFGGKFFTSWAVKNQHLLGKKRRSKRKRQNKEKNRVNGVFIEVNLNGNVQRKVNDVICVSDDSDDECIIQDITNAQSQNVLTGFPKKYNENDETSKKPESDNDDIIYIPPPPIEVVTLDGDDKDLETLEPSHSAANSLSCTNKLSSNSPKCIQKELSTPESSTSNDFLDSVGIENNTQKFNFSLHGSDFNNSQGEFVRPANPVDFCETESSCSTNDLNRDFNNSVKTIVFDEVEFPREDIFSENNLERFGTYITPRRTKSKELDENATVNSKNTETKDLVEVDSSSDSSSESDYEPVCINNFVSSGQEYSKKLPNLSPMLPDSVVTDLTTPKKGLLKRKTASEFFKDQLSTKDPGLSRKDLSKRKSGVDFSETDSETSKETPKTHGSKQPKRNKKMFKRFEAEDTSGKKSSKQNQSRSLENYSKTLAGNPDAQKKRRKKKQTPQSTEGDDVNLEIAQGKKKKCTSETNNSESTENTDESTPQKKRKKKTVQYDVENTILVDDLPEVAEVNIQVGDSEKPQGKNSKGSSDSKNTENEETGLGSSATQRKKRKNSIGTKTPQSECIGDDELVHQAEDNIRRDSLGKFHSRKKKGYSESHNSGNEDTITVTRKKKKRNVSGSKSPENNNDAGDTEMIVKMRKDRSSGSTSVPESEGTRDENTTDKAKKKRKKNEKQSTETDCKQQKIKKISFSALLDQQSLGIEDKIEAEMQKKKKKKSSPTLDPAILENEHIETTLNLTAESDDLIIDVGLNPAQEKEKRTKENLQQLDESLGHKLGNELTVNLTNQTKISSMIGIEENDSDEELIVVDEIDPDASVIIVDETDSTVINAETDLAVVLSSESELDFRELGDVGKDLELANCTVQPNTADDSEELIVVDDNSGSNFAGRYTVNEDYSNFDVEAIQRTQSDDPEVWKISHKDRVIPLNADRKRGQRCNRCRHFGHIAVRCTEKIYPPNCSLCGNPGHQEPRCPNKICTQCGNEGDYSTTYCWKCFKFRNVICKTCNMKGHIAKTCPDLWRRYHLTTKEGTLVVSQQPQLKPRDQLWCSGCAQQGHMEHECSYFREYPPTKLSVVSYEDVLPPVLHQENANNLHQRSARLSASSPLKDVRVCPRRVNSLPCPENNIPDHCSLKNISPSQTQIVPILSSDSSPQEPRVLDKDKVLYLKESSDSNSVKEVGRNLTAPSPSDKPVQCGIPVASQNENKTLSSDSQNKSNEICKLSSQSIPSSDIVPQSACKDVSSLQIVSDVPPTTSTKLLVLPLNNFNPSPSVQGKRQLQFRSVQGNKYWLPLSVSNDCSNFTERDYDNVILVANPGLLKHIRSIQFSGGFPCDNVQEQIHPVRASMIEPLIGNLIREDQQKIKYLIMYEHSHVVREFLQKEIRELNCWVSKRDPVFLKEQYFKYNRLSQIQVTTKTLSDKCFWFRILNMFIFGVHELNKGKRLVNILRTILAGKNLDMTTRNTLVDIHKYIFGVNKHSGINYPVLIDNIINKK